MYKHSIYSTISYNKLSEQVLYNKITKRGIRFSKELEELLNNLVHENSLSSYIHNEQDRKLTKIILQELVERGLIVPDKFSDIEEAVYLEGLSLCIKPVETFFNSSFLEVEKSFLSNKHKKSKEILFFGVPFDSNSPKPGSRFGADLIRVGSKNIINLAGEIEDFYFKGIKICDLGNINVSSNNFTEIINKITKVINYIPVTSIPIMVGGDHSLSYATITSLYKKHKYEDFVLIHIDHHYDLQFWGEFEGDKPSYLTKLTHANFLTWIKNKLPNLQIFHLGIQAYNQKLTKDNRRLNQTLKKSTVTNLDLVNFSSDKIQNFLPNNKKIYISLDVDVINNYEVCATGYPSSFGVSLTKLYLILEMLMKTNTLIGADIMEFGLSNNYHAHQKQAETISYLILHIISLLSISENK